MINRLQSTHGKKKRKVLTWCVTSLWILGACTSGPNNSAEHAAQLQEIKGETQGTTYTIKVVNGSVEIEKQAIDSILHAFDLSLSGYHTESIISQLNASESTFEIPRSDLFFIHCLAVSEKIAKQTNGSFDPTVLPLIALWGFLKNTEKIPSQLQIDSTLAFIGFNNTKLWRLEENKQGHAFIKKDARLKLDFNAIAQGYSVDVIADYLRKKGCEDFYVEIGGELVVSGSNSEGTAWRIGIDKPVSSNDGKGSRVISAVLSVQNKGIATSGNYRKFYKKGGKIYAHTLHPKTGRPAENELLSATVVAENAAEADGMATAFMVMGLKESKQFLASHQEYEAFFIFTEKENEISSFATKGMNKMLEK
jgi:thiamine biosynthesis lipoprotein